MEFDASCNSILSVSAKGEMGFFRTMYGRAVIANTGKSPSVLENLKKFEAIYNSEACMMVLWIPPPTYAYLPIGLLYIAHST
jgi:hypothetical protein